MSDEVVVVDENDNFIRNAPRKKIHNSKEWHRGVHSFLFNRKGELLLILRSRNKDKFPLHWECAISEHVNPGESYRGALERGLREELGVVPGKLDRFVKFRMAYGPEDCMVCELFVGKIDKLPKINRDEIEKIEFVPAEKITGSIENGNYTPWLKELFRHYTGMESEIEVMK